MKKGRIDQLAADGAAFFAGRGMAGEKLHVEEYEIICPPENGAKRDQSVR